ncbi:ABC transporter substrate-binding protein [Paenibacillus algorifonticola]|uniref:ABC transporter substrate-binding protein n=1 Tax=Paenibacillus algorifonticola TaxID=684063 RepID=UPI003D2D42A8
MRKNMWVGLMLVLVLVISACGSSKGNGNTGEQASTAPSSSAEATDSGAKENYKISISQYVEHPSLDATREGFIAALNDAGLVEGQNLTIDFNTAQADQANNQTLAQKIAADKSDLALGIATPSAQALVKEVTDRPVLFAAVTDPIDSKLVTNLDAPGGLVSGASDTNPAAITELMDFVAANFPKVKNVGLVINEGEPNAVVMAKIAEESLAKHDIKLVRAAVSNTSEVQQAAASLVGKVDALYITLDNSVVSSLDTLIKVANDNDLPFFASDRDTVERGAFATIGFKYYDHGYQVGQMAVDILKNGKKPGDMKVTVPDKLDLILNMKAAKEQGITVTDEMKNQVKDAASNIIE